MSHDACTIKYNPFMGQNQSKGMFSPMFYCPKLNFQLLLLIVQIVTYLVEVYQCGLADILIANIKYLPILIANSIYNFVEIWHFGCRYTLPIANFWLIYERLSNYWCNSSTRWTLAHWCSCMCTPSPSYLSPHLHVPPSSHLHHAHLHWPSYLSPHLNPVGSKVSCLVSVVGIAEFSLHVNCVGWQLCLTCTAV